MNAAVDPGLVNLMGAVSLAVSDGIRQVTEGSGRGASSPGALVLIDRYPGITVELLGRFLQLSQSGAVRLVDRLVKQAWVERQRGEDRRFISLSLTEAGTEQVQRILDSRQQVIAELLHPLTSQEQDQLRTLLIKLASARALSSEQEEYICRLCDLGSCPLDLCVSRVR